MLNLAKLLLRCPTSPHLLKPETGANKTLVHIAERAFNLLC
jgi:hypothetical protein